MDISVTKSVSIIVVCSLVTFLTRYLPFLLFNSGKNEVPKLVLYLGEVLPPAVIAVLVIYCLKDTVLTDIMVLLPQLISVVAVFILHIWKKHYLLSIGVGTLCYVILTNFVFV